MSDNTRIEALREKLNRDNTLIDIKNYGAGSKLTGKTIRAIHSIANGGITTTKYSKLFQQLIRYFNCKNIVELGTSLGINTLYFATSTPEVRVSTFEGCTSTADIAERIFIEFGARNIEIIRGNIDDTLPSFITDDREIDFVFIDANHTYQSTLGYMNLVMPNLSKNAIVIIDDIYWSKDMTSAWKKIKNHFPGIARIDIYQCGILIFDNTIPAEELRIAF